MSNDQQAGASSCCGHGAAPEPTQATKASETAEISFRRHDSLP